ncbi:MAG: tetratricopeptide repeat protein [Planctomycetia bacterium]|nr:tetratricopeptide repeat protein [Planctomycetia bacterium]
MKVPQPPGTRRPLWVSTVLVGSAVILAWSVRAWTKPGEDPDSLWRQGQVALQANRFERAEAALAGLGRLRPPTPEDRLLKAQIDIARHRDDRAISGLLKIPDGHRMAAQARMLAGQVELRRKHVRAAEACFLAAVRLDPGLVQAHRELIYIYGMLLRRPELHAEFLALSRLVPLTFDNAFHWCLTRNAVWDAKEITEQLRSYITADPSDRWSRLALAENLRRVGRRDESESVLGPLAASDPDARAVRARLALDRGDERAAEALLSEGPEDHPELARLRGRFAMARRDGPAAVKHFRAAYKAEPDYRDTLFGLGQALTMVGDAAAAAPFLAAARDLDAFGSVLQRAAGTSGRDDPKLLLDLGAACEKARRYPEARAWYHLAVDANPLNPEAQKALFRLKDRDPGPAR